MAVAPCPPTSPRPKLSTSLRSERRPIIRAVFGPFNIPVYYSRLDGPVGPVEPTLLRFNLSPAFFRGVAKVAFHYFLWACPQIGGDEEEFSDLKAYIRDGIGEPTDFLYMTDSLVDRMPADEGQGKDAHVFASFVLDADLVVQAHFLPACRASFPNICCHVGAPAGRPADRLATGSRCRLHERRPRSRRDLERTLVGSLSRDGEMTDSQIPIFLYGARQWIRDFPPEAGEAEARREVKMLVLPRKPAAAMTDGDVPDALVTSAMTKRYLELDPPFATVNQQFQEVIIEIDYTYVHGSL